MTRNVVAVDATVFYASVARIIEGEPAPKCGGVITKSVEGFRHHLAAEYRKQREFAERIADRVLNGGEPELVVLRKPEVGNTRTDPSGARRVGVFWELVRAFDDAGVPVADVPIHTVTRLRGLKPSASYTDLAASCAALYPEVRLPEIDGKPDARYRATTIGLAVVGALVAGIETPIPVTDEVRTIVRRGGDYPPRFVPDAEAQGYAEQTASLKRNRVADKKRRASDWYDEQFALIGSAPLAEIEARFGSGGPRNAKLRAAWRKRMEKEGR